MTRNTHLALRSIARLICDLGLLVGAVTLGVLAGGTVLLLAAQAQHPAMRLLVLPAGLAAFAAGVAGRDHVVGYLETWLDPGPPEDDEGGPPIGGPRAA